MKPERMRLILEWAGQTVTRAMEDAMKNKYGDLWSADYLGAVAEFEAKHPKKRIAMADKVRELLPEKRISASTELCQFCDKPISEGQQSEPHPNYPGRKIHVRCADATRTGEPSALKPGERFIVVKGTRRGMKGVIFSIVDEDRFRVSLDTVPFAEVLPASYLEREPASTPT